jgi:hypothetical protein
MSALELFETDHFGPGKNLVTGEARAFPRHQQVQALAEERISATR